jgi:hypothetical protein
MGARACQVAAKPDKIHILGSVGVRACTSLQPLLSPARSSHSFRDIVTHYRRHPRFRPLRAIMAGSLPLGVREQDSICVPSLSLRNDYRARALPSVHVLSDPTRLIRSIGSFTSMSVEMKPASTWLRCRFGNSILRWAPLVLQWKPLYPRVLPRWTFRRKKIHYNLCILPAGPSTC